MTFAPPARDRFTANVVLLANFQGQQNTFSVPLSGYGGGPIISCTPSALQFGVVPCGAPTSLPIICTNIGANVIVPDSGPVDPSFWSWSVTSSAPDVCQVQVLGPDGGVSSGQSVELDVQCSCPQGYDGGDVVLTIASPSFCGNDSVLRVSGVCGCQ